MRNYGFSRSAGQEMLPAIMPVDLSVASVATTSTPQPRNFRVLAVIVASSLFMEQLDATVLTTALPTMAHSFGVAPLHMSLALTSYLLSLAIFIPASGWIADRYGARHIFCVSIGIFTLGSILCGLAGSLEMLVAARLLQGLGGAMMVPVGRLILLRNVAKTDLIAAMSWLLVPALLGPILGPPVGGFIVTYLDWRWIFYINVPIGLIGIALAAWLIPDIKEPPQGGFDSLGLILSGIALACLTFGVELGGRGVFSGTQTLMVIGIAAVSFALYLLHARRLANPILDMSLMRIPTFSLSVIAGALTRITGGAMPFLLPMMMQLGFGMSAAESGMVTFMSAIGFMLMKAGATPILRRYGFRSTMVWNALFATALIAACAAFRPSWPLWLMYAVLLAGGFLQSLQFAAYNTIAYADIPRDRMSSATSFYATFQQLMLSLGICLASGVLHVSVTFSGHEHAQLSDFSLAILVVTAISFLASPVSLLFPKTAGDDMRGIKPRAGSAA